MELEIIKWIQQFSSQFMDFLFLGITQLGEENVFVVLVTLIYWTIDKRFGKVLGLSLMATLVVNNGLKELFSFERPIGEEGIRSLRVETATGKSFPSGHTQSSSTFYTSLAIFIKRKWFQVMCWIIIFFIGISRLYLGVHYPKDVIVAWILGVGIAFVIYKLMNILANSMYIYLILLVVGLILLPFSLSEDYYKAFGLLLGFILGLVIEERYIEFKMSISNYKKLLRFMVGIVLVLAIKIGLKGLLPEAFVSDMFRYFAVGLVAVGLYPLLFNRMNF